VRGVVEKCLQLRLPVIVVDDGSTDSTPDILASLSGVTVIHHERNQGKGASLPTGFDAAPIVSSEVGKALCSIDSTHLKRKRHTKNEIVKIIF
jgi:glycosyltransferase involved in cell wall biosynthesis